MEIDFVGIARAADFVEIRPVAAVGMAAVLDHGHGRAVVEDRAADSDAEVGADAVADE